LAFWVFISFHFGPFGASFPLFLAFLVLHFLHFAFWTLISFHFGLLSGQKGHPARIWPKLAIFPLNFAIFPFQKFAVLGLHFSLLDFFSYIWPFAPSFPYILAFWAFISFHFGPFGASFPLFLAFWGFIPSFWPFGCWFPFILAFGAVQKGHPARIGPKIAIFPLDFAIFSFQKFAALGRKCTNQKPKQHIDFLRLRFVLEIFGPFELSFSKE